MKHFLQSHYSCGKKKTAKVLIAGLCACAMTLSSVSPVMPVVQVYAARGG